MGENFFFYDTTTFFYVGRDECTSTVVEFKTWKGSDKRCETLKVKRKGNKKKVRVLWYKPIRESTQRVSFWNLKK